MYDIKDFEIMAPVGSRESLAAAIQAGADSIYFGIESLNMRARSASTFTINDLHEINGIGTCLDSGRQRLAGADWSHDFEVFYIVHKTFY